MLISQEVFCCISLIITLLLTGGTAAAPVFSDVSLSVSTGCILPPCMIKKRLPPCKGRKSRGTTFIFPGIAEYHDPKFDASLLTMLGAKSTCKDRWRQVLAEADRIENKHLLTLEAAISTHQTDEMMSKNLQLVIPRAIHKTNTPAQQTWLMDVISFMHLLKIRQING